MLYFKCPTCSTFLANKEIPWELGMKEICDNPKLSQEEKDMKKVELLDKLKVTRYCCRMRVLTYCDLVKIVK
jgi:DNA-directed RNA polymerase subunit N (RpoN/RPB10)